MKEYWVLTAHHEAAKVVQVIDLHDDKKVIEASRDQLVAGGLPQGIHLEVTPHTYKGRHER